APRVGRDGDRGRQVQHSAAAADHERRGIPARRPEHPLPRKAHGRAERKSRHRRLIPCRSAPCARCLSSVTKSIAHRVRSYLPSKTPMPFLELSLIVRTEQQPGAEAALDDLGALSITLRDADAETPDEQAIFEPGVGELPL